MTSGRRRMVYDLFGVAIPPKHVLIDQLHLYSTASRSGPHEGVGPQHCAHDVVRGGGQFQEGGGDLSGCDVWSFASRS